MKILLFSLRRVDDNHADAGGVIYIEPFEWYHDDYRIGTYAWMERSNKSKFLNTYSVKEYIFNRLDPIEYLISGQLGRVI